MELLAQRGESRFFVHKDILASQSRPLRCAIACQWIEAADRRVDLGDWDSATVSWLVEFLYRGSYPIPDPDPISSDCSPVAPESQSSSTRPLTRLRECLNPIPQRNVEANIERLAIFDPAQYNYREVLLSHAKVYHLANHLALERLRTLALHHLLNTLSRIDPMVPASGSHLAGNIVDFARYVYANTDRLEIHEEPLRKLVSHFIGFNFSTLKSSPEMVRLLGEGGDIVMDVMVNVNNRQPVSRTPIVPATVTRSPNRYVAKLLVSAIDSSDDRDAPHDHLRELNRTSASVNWCNGSRYVQTLHPHGFALTFPSHTWLYLGYTPVPDDACTGFTVEIGVVETIPPGTAEITSYRRVLREVDPAVKEKITAVALLRQSEHLADVSAIPAKHGIYDGMTADINQGRNGDYLYIVWKSVHVA